MEQRAYETIRVALDGPTLRITLAVPERKNALSPTMVNELLYALDDARACSEVRVIVLTGEGNAFCAGGDLKQMRGGSEGPRLEPRGDYADLLLRFGQLGIPTIARLNGYAYGGGLGLVACCEFAVAEEHVKVGTPEIHRGLFPMMIMAVLGRLVPRRELVSMMLLGERMEATEAKRLGILSHVVPAGALDDTVQGLCEALAKRSPTAMRMGLRALHRQSEMSLEEALPYLRQQLFALLATEDAREGLRAFFEKREPRWTGR